MTRPSSVLRQPISRIQLALQSRDPRSDAPSDEQLLLFLCLRRARTQRPESSNTVSASRRKPKTPAQQQASQAQSHDPSSYPLASLRPSLSPPPRRRCRKSIGRPGRPWRRRGRKARWYTMPPRTTSAHGTQSKQIPPPLKSHPHRGKSGVRAEDQPRSQPRSQASCYDIGKGREALHRHALWMCAGDRRPGREEMAVGKAFGCLR